MITNTLKLLDYMTIYFYFGRQNKLLENIKLY